MGRYVARRYVARRCLLAVFVALRYVAQLGSKTCKVGSPGSEQKRAQRSSTELHNMGRMALLLPIAA